MLLFLRPYAYNVYRLMAKWKARQQRIYWNLVLQCMRHRVPPGSHKQKQCPSLEMKLPEEVEPKPASSFSVYAQVKGTRAPPLQLTQNNDGSWQTNPFCTCLSSVDVESFSSNLWFFCFCILNFDSVFFKYVNIFFLTTGTGLMWGWADCLPLEVSEVRKRRQFGRVLICTTETNR